MMSQTMSPMMDRMMWVGGVIAVLVIIVLLRVAAALLKYLFWKR